MNVRNISYNEKSLKGKNVIITGGSSGIGLALAKLFCSYGSNVILIARDITKLNSAKESLENMYQDKCDVSVVSLDLSANYRVLEHCLNNLMSKLGSVDILINCAGYAFARTFLTTSPEEIEGMFRTNYLASVYVTKIVLPYMLLDDSDQTKNKRIAFICSMAGQIGIYGMAAYTGSKYAIRGFAEVLDMELHTTGPIVTIAFPPDTDTPGFSIENMGKPQITKVLSSTVGLSSADNVAKSIFKDILNGKLISSFGVEGLALSCATSGMLPTVTLGHRTQFNWLCIFVVSCFEILAAGPLRAFAIIYAYWMRRTITKNSF